MRLTPQRERALEITENDMSITRRENKTYLIHGSGHSYDECKVLEESDDKYSKGKHTN